MVIVNDRAKAVAGASQSRLAAIGLLLPILIGAAYLRLANLEHSWIGPDQSILFSIAMRFVNGGSLPLAANKSSAGIMNPPLIEYLLALPLWLKPTVLTAVRFHALLGVAAVMLLYLYISRLFGQRAGLIAALLLAVNPWSIFYSRFVWNPNAIPLFATLMLGSLLAYVACKRHPFHLALIPVGLAAITQLHLSSLVLLPTVGLIALLFWRRRQDLYEKSTLAALLLGVGLFILLYLPYFLYEWSTGVTNIQASIQALTGGPRGEAQQVWLNAAAFLLALELVTGNHIFGSAYDYAAAEVWRQAVWPWFPLVGFAHIWFLSALLYALIAPLRWLIRKKTRARPLPPRLAALLLLAIWILTPLLLYVRHTVYLQNYYFLFLLPAPFILMALAAEELLTTVDRCVDGRPYRQAVNAIFLFPVLLLAVWQFHLYQVRLGLAGATTIEATRQAQDIDRAIEASRAALGRYPGCGLIIAGEANHLESSSLGLLEDFVHPVPVRYAEAGRGFLIPSQCTVYLVVRDDPLLTGWLEAEAVPLADTVQTRHETWRFYYVAGSAEAGEPAMAAWDNGLELVAFTVSDVLGPGDQLKLDYRWRVQRPPAGYARYHFFNHLVDGEGRLISQEDAPAVQSLYWQAGDHLVTQYYLQLPAEAAEGEFTIYTGLYTWPGLERVWLDNGRADVYPVAAISFDARREP
jgi:4-amino-4-deoxy-L-arabinose transferase-like glycosyltransferase